MNREEFLCNKTVWQMLLDCLDGKPVGYAVAIQEGDILLNVCIVDKDTGDLESGDGKEGTP